MFNVYYYKWQWIDDQSDFEIFDILAFFGWFLRRWITRWRRFGFWFSSSWRSSAWRSRRCFTWSKTFSGFLILFELNKICHLCMPNFFLNYVNFIDNNLFEKKGMLFLKRFNLFWCTSFFHLLESLIKFFNKNFPAAYYWIYPVLLLLCIVSAFNLK